MRKRRLVGSIALLALVVGSVGATGGAASSQPSPRLRATPLSPAGPVIRAGKSASSRLARTDPSLLRLAGSRPVQVMVKLDYDAAAAYSGGVRGLRATSPAATGRSLRANRPALRAYTRYVRALERRVIAGITARVPRAQVVGRYRIAYGGLALQVPANRIADLLRVPGVVAVQRNGLEHPLTDASPKFIGATRAWRDISGRFTSGEGVIVGVLDTGIWPEHPSFADPGIDHPGGTFGCEFGDGSDPDLGAPFTCNDKLIGAYAFVDTYTSFLPVLPGEFCDQPGDPTGTPKTCSARDADGHGTHTSSTAAGGPVASVDLFGVQRGPISGMAPGAHVIMYRVCLDAGCFQSDSVAAVQQAILDGADVLNFSISGGSSAYTDPVELAFLDAYAAGILVNASAGNSGPGAGTANHAGPWTNTVGASTSNRHFIATLSLAADGGDTLDLQGVTITPGVDAPTPVVLAQDVPGYAGGSLCAEPFAPGSVDGLVVACERGVVARVEKGFNVLQGGGEGMILYNTGVTDVETDNHWLPAIHLNVGPGADLLAFLDSHTGVTATWTTGVATPVTGDVMASFSSRGPVGDFLKPDVTSVGIQVLAGHTPDPHDANIVVGPPGQLYQAIAGTSMSSPHAAGAAALVKAANPGFTPGQVKSALMTSAVQTVLKEDGVTPADPFERGAGSVRANRAIHPTVTFDVDPADYFASAADPLGRIDLNLPSVNAPTMPGEVTTTRTLTNVSGKEQLFTVNTRAPEGAAITVTPKRFTVAPGASKTITITITAPELAEGQYFGQVKLDARKSTAVDAVLPVAFFKRQGAVSLEHACDPTTIAAGTSAGCHVTVENLAPVEAAADLEVKGPRGGKVLVRNVSAPGIPEGNGFTWSGPLSAALPPTVDAIVPGGTGFGYLPLAAFGVPPLPDLGDEGAINLDTPEFLYGSEPYTRVAVVSNGYAVVGGAESQDIDFVPQTFPDPARPNNVLGAFWTDLNQAAGGETFAALLSDGVRTWIVLEWAGVPSFSDPSLANSFQVWIETAATAEGISYEYGTVEGSADPLNVGAENRDGSSGVNLGAVPATGDELSVLASPPTPGGSVTITYDAFGVEPTTAPITASLTSSVTVGTTIEVVTVTVT